MAKAEKSWRDYFHIRDLRLFDQSLTAIQHHLLLFLKTCMDEEGKCYWGIDTIAARTGWARRTVQAAMKTLIQKNYVLVIKKGGHSHKDTNWYALNSNLLKSVWDMITSARQVNYAKAVENKLLNLIEYDHLGAGDAPTPGITYPQECTSQQPRVHHTANMDALNAPKVINEDIKEVFLFRKDPSTQKTLLPDGFQPNEEHVFQAKIKDLDVFERLGQFKASCKSQRKKSYDWNEEFKAYLLGSYKKRSKPYSR